MYSTTKKHKILPLFYINLVILEYVQPIDIITMSLIYADEAGLCIHTSTNHIPRRTYGRNT